tara:strand:- start:1152 stop:1658 length:507 start_codon:yes stop_codon:yes gene_type:complete
MKIFKLTSALFISTTIFMVGCNDSSSSSDNSMNMDNSSSSLTFMNFYARATQDEMSAAYGMIMNKTNNDINLTGVKITDKIIKGMAEMHQTTIKEGIASMAKIEALTIPANGSVTLEPGGLHIMLMKLQGPLIKGDPLSLSFNDSNNNEYAVILSIEKIAMDMDHGKH